MQETMEMKKQNTPKMIPLALGNTFKVLQVTGSVGMTMPGHYSTKEAVITVQKGTAILKMKGIDHLLTIHKSFIIPAGVEHELQITDDFQAVVIMEADSEIKFIAI